MSTGEKLIRATQWQPLDGSSSNAAPGFGVVAGSQTQKIQVPILGFDGAGSTIEYACYTTRVPVDYAAGGTFKILWMANSTSGTVKWQAQVGAVTPADPDTPLEHAWGTAATVTDTVNATEARRLMESTITLNMDSAAAGDAISFLISRDPANDTCTADAELISVAWQYTADDQAGSPLGYIGQGSATSDQTGISTITDVTGCSVAFTALAGRRYKISAHVRSDASASGAIARWSITDSSNTVLQLIDVVVTTSGVSEQNSGWVIISPSAGSYTAKLRLEKLSGSGTVQSRAGSTFPVTILVEDIGT